MTYSTALAQQQRINTNTSSFKSTSNPLPLKTIFRQVENSVVQITTGVTNPQNSPSSNATTLGCGFVYDKRGHIADGHDITTSDDLVNYIGQHKSAGDSITLTVYRNGHAIDLKATLAARLSLLSFLTTGSAAPSMPQPPIRPPTIPTPHP